ncbi:hypothetical protein D1007_04648 [Hordeum vulgare]|nr:hypothetical protein D1007_04648 [Hordeum vulgare]
MKQEKGQGGGGGGRKLGRWLGAPVRALSRACDSYVRKMSACAGAMPTQYAGAMGRGGAGAMHMQAATFSSRSTRRGDDDVGELVRAMSQRQQGSAASPAAASVPPRSRSVAVGRIDEDAPCDFGADAGRVGLPAPPPVRRSRSAAVGSGLPPRVGGGGGFGAATIKKAAVVHGG